MTKEEVRKFTKKHLLSELNNLADNYMKVYDEYYQTNSRDSAFLKDLVDSVIGVSAVLEVYTRDGKIHPNYAIEKLNNSKSYIEACLRFYENKEKKENE